MWFDSFLQEMDRRFRMAGRRRRLPCVAFRAAGAVAAGCLLGSLCCTGVEAFMPRHSCAATSKSRIRPLPRPAFASVSPPSLEETPSMLQLASIEGEARSFSVSLEGASSSEKVDLLSQLLIDVGAQGVSYDPSPPDGSFRIECWWHSEDKESWEGGVRTAMGLAEVKGWEIDEPVPIPMEAEWKAAAEGEGFKPVIAGKFQVVPVQAAGLRDVPEGLEELPILSGMGWGDGRHPTTRLCLEFLCKDGVVGGGERVIDYGTGSGVLAIAAMRLGAMECVGVDICYDALSNAVVNTQLNAVSDSVDVMHGRTIVPGDFPPADVVIGNILVGTLLSLSSVIISLTKPGGWLCLSGIRPEQVDIVKRKYEGQIEWDDSMEDRGEHPTWGWWVRIAGRRRLASRDGDREDWIRAMSEAVVS